MRRNTSHIVPLLSVLLMLSALPTDTQAQRLNFGLFAGDIQITQLNELNFNEKFPIIVSNQGTVQIGLADMIGEMAVFEIIAARDYDITIDVDAPSNLLLNGTETGEGKEIPFTLGWAYSNTGLTSDLDAKADAITVPQGFTSATMPVLRRNSGSGPPGPPPRPRSGNYQEVDIPQETVYLFVFGSLDVGPVDAGVFSETITITVQYTNNPP